MKKFLLITVTVGILLFAAVAFYLASNAQHLAEKYKPEIEKKASAALDAQVKLGKLSVSVFPSIKVGVDALAIKRPNASTQGLTLKNITLDIDTFALLGGTFVVDELSVSKPHISVIKENGITWIEGLPKKQAATAQKQKPAPANTTEAKKTAGVSSAFAFALNSFSIQDGQITIDDRDAKKLQSISAINVSSSIKLLESIIELPETTISLTALHSIPLTIKTNGISFDTATNTVHMPDNTLSIFGNSIKQSATLDLRAIKGKANIKIARLQLASLVPTIHSLAPATKAISIDGVISNTLDIDIKSSSNLLADGKLDFEGVSLQKEALQLSKLTGPISIDVSKNAKATTVGLLGKKLTASLNGSPLEISLDFSSTANKARINDFAVKAFDGVIALKTAASLVEPKQFESGISVRDIHLGKLIATGIPSIPQSIEGTLEELDVTLSGVLSEALKQSVRGTGDILIRDGRIKGVNIARSTLQTLKLPFLEQEIYKLVPNEFQDFFNEEDTQLKELSARWTIANEQLQLQSLRLASTFYELQGTGSISFMQKLNLKTRLIFSKEFSEKFAAKTKESKYLIDDNGQLVIPLDIRGTAPKVVLLPDAEYLMKLQAGKALKGEASKALDKVLGEKGGKASKAIKEIFGF